MDETQRASRKFRNGFNSFKRHKPMKKTIISISIFASVLFTGCATLISGTTDKVSFKSEPPGAVVLLDGVQIGNTGNDILIRKKFVYGERKITFVKEGYEDLNFIYEVEIDGVYWLGVMGLGIPNAIDILTGAVLKSKYDKYEKTLIKK